MKPRKALTSHFSEQVTFSDESKTRGRKLFYSSNFLHVAGIRYAPHYQVPENDPIFETNIKVILNNTERYVSFEISEMRFLDSFLFPLSSLYNLVKNLEKSHFQYTKHYMPNNDLVFRKGVFPYQ